MVFFKELGLCHMGKGRKHMQIDMTVNVSQLNIYWLKTAKKNKWMFPQKDSLWR